MVFEKESDHLMGRRFPFGVKKCLKLGRGGGCTIL